MVESYAGEPSAQEGQGQGWFSLEQLTSLQFPEANKEIITELVKLSH
jgi:8-oxo-dGTP diphosphatase